MNANGAVALILAAIIAGVIAFVVTNQYQGWQTAEIGSLTIARNEQTNIRFLINRTNGVATGNYDSFDHLRGTTFTVPAGQVFVLSEVCFVDGAGPAAGFGQFGYGDTAVANSAAPPTNALTALTFEFAIGECYDVYLEIPAGKILFAVADGTWQASVAGVIR